MKAEKSSAEQSVRQPLSPRINKAVAFTLSARLELSAVLKWKRGEWDRETRCQTNTLFWRLATHSLNESNSHSFIERYENTFLPLSCSLTERQTHLSHAVTLIWDDLTYRGFKLQVCKIKPFVSSIRSNWKEGNNMQDSSKPKIAFF